MPLNDLQKANLRTHLHSVGSVIDGSGNPISGGGGNGATGPTGPTGVTGATGSAGATGATGSGPSGTSFPGSPGVGDPYWRTDLKMWFVYMDALNGWLPYGAGGRNLLTNGSFETGLTGWSVTGAHTSQSGFTATDGDNSILFTGVIGFEYAFQTIHVRSGRIYRASFWMFTGSGPSSTAGAGIQVEGLGSFTGDISRLITANFPNTWTQYGFWFTATADDTSVNIVVTNSYGGTSTGDIFIDAVVLQEVGPMPFPHIE